MKNSNKKSTTNLMTRLMVVFCAVLIVTSTTFVNVAAYDGNEKPIDQTLLMNIQNLT